MAGSTTCRTCGQANAEGTEFCVRCGTKVPDPESTQVVAAPGGEQEYPWEPPAEWDPGHLESTGGQQQTYVGRQPDQVGWNTGNDTGAGAPQTPWAAQGQPTFPPITPPPGGSTPYPGYQGQPAPKQGGSKKPLFIGGGAVVAIAVIVAIVLVATGGSKKKNTNGGGGDTTLNGVQTQTGTEALDSARVALRNAKTARIAGTVSSDGQDIRFDVQLSGDDSQGTLTLGGNDAQLIKIGDTVYIKGDKDFLTKYAGGDAAAVEKLNGKWLKSDSTSDFDQFSIDGFADTLKSTGTDTKVIEKTTQSTLAGKPVVVISQADGSKLTIANTGDPYPLSLDAKPGATGQVTFSEYNAAVTITAPEDFIEVDASATPTPSADPIKAQLPGAYDCSSDTDSGGGVLTLGKNQTYTVSGGTGGSWGSSGDHIAFVGGNLDKYTAIYDETDTFELKGAGANSDVSLTCVLQ
jgi:hypothetical protein